MIKMRLTKEFIIKDILNYESTEDINIINELQNLSLDVVIDLIKIGNQCSYERALEIYDEASKEMDLQGIVEQLAVELIGREPDDNNDKNIDNKEFKSLSDIFENFYNELQTVDEKLTLTEFWSLSTRYMYRYADGVKQRYIFDKNKKLRDDYDYIAMFSSALNGKLKKCPQLNADGTVHKDSLEEKIQMLKNRR